MRLNSHEVRLNIKTNIKMNIPAGGSMDQMGGLGNRGQSRGQGGRGRGIEMNIPAGVSVGQVGAGE